MVLVVDVVAAAAAMVCGGGGGCARAVSCASPSQAQLLLV